MNIGDLFFGARIDGSNLQLDAQRLGQAAGLAGGQSLSQSLGAAVRTNAKQIIGAAFGAGVGLALVGANQLDAATKRFQADTGATAAEAARAEHAIAGMYQHNLQGFDQIGATLSGVVSDLHLSGTAAEGAAAHFLRFETAANLDASAVDSVRGVLDAWDLTAADSTRVMDALIASHQQYGTNLQEDMDLLVKLSPTLQAANLNWLDGVAMLNLFTKAGISAEKIPTALTRALTQVHSPEELRKLLVDIGKIEDPFKRAQAAAAAFGNRAGPQLAQALSRGGLAEFSIDMDKAAGATDRASGAVESGFGAQFTLLLHRAGGALAEFGTQFGGLAMLASVAGPRIVAAIGGLAGLLAPALGGVWRRVAATSVVSAAIGFAADQAGTVYLKALFAKDALGAALSAAWAATGGAMLAAVQASGFVAGGTFAAAFGAAVVAAAIAVPIIFIPVIQEHLPDITGGLQGQLKQRIDDILSGRLVRVDAPKAGAALATGMASGYADALGRKPGDAMVAAWRHVTGGLEGSALGLGERIGVTLAAGLTTTAGRVASSARDLGDRVGAGLVAGLNRQGAVFAKALFAQRQPVKDAWAALVSAEAEAETPTQERAQILGELASAGLLRGLRNGDPAVQEQARATKQALEDRLAELDKTLGPIGQRALAALTRGWAAASRRAGNLAGAAVAQGIRDKRSAVDQSWQDLLDGLKNSMSKTSEVALLLGHLVSKELARGLKDRDSAVRAQARATKQIIIDRLLELKPTAGTLTRAAMDELKTAMKSKDPDIRAAAHAVYVAATSSLDKIPGQALTDGQNIGDQLSQGMYDRLKEVRTAAARLGNAISDYLRIRSPAKLGPLSLDGGPEGWGLRLSTSLARGMTGGAGDVSAASALVAGAAVPRFGMTAPAYAAPSPAWAAMSHGPRVEGGLVAGVVNNYYPTANVTGLVKATSALEIARQLGRFARSGQMTPASGATGA